MTYRRLTLSLLLVCSVLSTQATAKDLNGRFGVGLEQSLSGVSGITVRYWPTEAFGLSATVGANFITTESFDLVNARVLASGGFVYNVAQSLHANLGLGLRLAVGFETGDTSGDVAHVDIELPVAVEFFLSENFSISLATGILIGIIPREGPVLLSAVEGENEVNAPVADDSEANQISTSRGLLEFGIGAVTAKVGIVYYF